MWCLPGVRSLSLGLLAGHRFGLCQDPVGHSSCAPTTFLKSLQTQQPRPDSFNRTDDRAFLKSLHTQPPRPLTHTVDKNLNISTMFSTTPCYRPHTFLNSNFLCGDDVSEIKIDVLGLERAKTDDKLFQIAKTQDRETAKHCECEAKPLEYAS